MILTGLLAFGIAFSDQAGEAQAEMGTHASRLGTCIAEQALAMSSRAGSNEEVGAAVAEACAEPRRLAEAAAARVLGDQATPETMARFRQSSLRSAVRAVEYLRTNRARRPN